MTSHSVPQILTRLHSFLPSPPLLSQGGATVPGNADPPTLQCQSSNTPTGHLQPPHVDPGHLDGPPQSPTYLLKMPRTTCIGYLFLFPWGPHPCMILCPMTSPSQHPGSPGTLVPQSSAQIVSHTSVKSWAPPTPGSTRPPAPTASGSWHLPLPLTTSQPPSTPDIQEEDGRALGEGPGWGQEGRMPVGCPPVCPQLILAAFSLAWQSGPVAPAVILRFLGHCHAGSAAKWGAGGAGA